MPSELATFSRRDLLSLIGAVSGSAAMYHAMTSLGFASDSGYKGPIKLDGDPKGASVLILGAGLAGMTAALELRKAGYKVRSWNSTAGQADATGPCGAEIRSSNSAGSSKPANSSKAFISIRAHGEFPITIVRFSITASAWVSRSSHSSSSIIMRFCMRPARSVAFRSAFVTSRPISRARFRNCSPR